MSLHLVRGEALLYGPFLFVPLVYWMAKKGNGRALRQKLRYLTSGGIAALAVLAPWIVYTNSVYDEPVMITSATGRLLMFGSCDTPWHGDNLGMGANCFFEMDLWEDFKTIFPEANIAEIYDRTTYDASRVDGFYRDHALEYIGDHLSRYPIVMLARIERIFGIYGMDHTSLSLDESDLRSCWNSNEI